MSGDVHKLNADCLYSKSPADLKVPIYQGVMVPRTDRLLCRVLVPAMKVAPSYICSSANIEDLPSQLPLMTQCHTEKFDVRVPQRRQRIRNKGISTWISWVQDLWYWTITYRLPEIHRFSLQWYLLQSKQRIGNGQTIETHCICGQN